MNTSINRNFIDENEKPIVKSSQYKEKPITNLTDFQDPEDLNFSIDIEPDVVKASHNERSEVEETDEKDIELQTLNEYKSFIFENMQISEKFCEIYHKEGIQCKPKYRSALIDWLISINKEFGFEKDTLYLAISLFDRICRSRIIKRCHFQLFAATAMWISSKLRETTTPCLSDFIYLCDNAYSEREFSDCERAFCVTLAFSLDSPVPYDYILPVSAKAEYLDIYDTAEFFLNIALYSDLFAYSSPTVVAASVLQLAVKVTKSSDDCFSELENFKFDQKEVDSFSNSVIETFDRMARDGSKSQLVMIREGLEALPVTLPPLSSLYK